MNSERARVEGRQLAIVPGKKYLISVTGASISGGAIVVIAAIGLATLAFGSPLLELVRRWNQQEEYSHGFLIPFVTLWLLWARRDAFRANVDQPSWSGVILIVLSFAMYIIGELGATLILAQIGFVVALLGIVISAGGYTLLRVAVVPIGFLLFAIPLPHFAEAVLTLRLQHISSLLGVWIVGILGIPVYLDGNIVDMGTFKLQVAEACSGLRYVYPLLSLSFLVAYLFRAPAWQRLLIFLSSIPIAIGMNGLRIGLVGALVDRFGAQMAEGALHLFEGWVIFVVCGVLLLMEVYLLAKMSGKSWCDVFNIPEFPVRPPTRKATEVAVRGPLLGSVLLICAGGAATLPILIRPEILPQRTQFAEFPVHIGDWQGHPTFLDLETEQVLKPDDYILSDYQGPNGNPINLFVAYYFEHSPHSPSECIPAGGWKDTDDKEISYQAASGRVTLNRVIITKDSVRQLVYYWFDEHGRTFANQYWAKFYRLADGIWENRTDGALVRLVTPINSDESVQNADQRLQSFMQAALPSLADFVPSSTTPVMDSAGSQPADHRS